MTIDAIAPCPDARVVALLATGDPRHQDIGGSLAVARRVALEAAQHPMTVVAEPAVGEPPSRQPGRLKGRQPTRPRSVARFRADVAVRATTGSVEEDALVGAELLFDPTGGCRLDLLC